MQVVQRSLTPREHFSAMAASSSGALSGPTEPEQQGQVGGGFHHETREDLQRMGAVVHEEEWVRPHPTGRKLPAERSQDTPPAPSHGPEHVGVGASGEAGSLDMLRQEPSNAADQDAATRTASSPAPGSTSRTPDGPTASHSEADPEMAGMEPVKERESVDLSMRGLEGDPPVADRAGDAGSDPAAERQARRYPGGGAAGANAASGAVERTNNESASDEEGGFGALPKRH